MKPGHRNGNVDKVSSGLHFILVCCFSFPQAKQTTLKKESQEEPPAATGKENVSENIPDETPKPSATNPFKKAEKAVDTPPKKQSALQLWLVDNEKAVKEKFPDASEKDLLAKAAMMFKDVDADTKQVWLVLIF